MGSKAKTASPEGGLMLVTIIQTTDRERARKISNVLRSVLVAPNLATQKWRGPVCFDTPTFKVIIWGDGWMIYQTEPIRETGEPTTRAEIESLADDLGTRFRGDTMRRTEHGPNSAHQGIRRRLARSEIRRDGAGPLNAAASWRRFLKVLHLADQSQRHLQALFPGDGFRLEGCDFGGGGVCWLYVLTARASQDAEVLLGRFDDEWWLDVKPERPVILEVTCEFTQGDRW